MWNNIRKLDPESDLMHCYQLQDVATGKIKDCFNLNSTVGSFFMPVQLVKSLQRLSKLKTECKPASLDEVPDVDRLFIAKDSPAHQHFEMQPACNRP